MHHQSIKRKSSKKGSKKSNRTPKSPKRSAKRSAKKSPKKSVKRSARRSPRMIRIPMSIRSRITNVARKVKQAVSDELKDLDRII